MVRKAPKAGFTDRRYSQCGRGIGAGVFNNRFTKTLALLANCSNFRTSKLSRIDQLLCSIVGQVVDFGEQIEESGKAENLFGLSTGHLNQRQQEE